MAVAEEEMEVVSVPVVVQDLLMTVAENMDAGDKKHK
jgi:hypothetical protein